MIEHVLDIGGAHGVFAHEVGHRARIKRAGPSSHEQPVKRSKAHRRIDTASVTHRAEARAVSEMRDDHATAHEIGIDRPKPLGDELV